MDVWVDGAAFRDVQERFSQLSRLKDALEAKRKDVAKELRKSKVTTAASEGTACSCPNPHLWSCVVKACGAAVSSLLQQLLHLHTVHAIIVFGRTNQGLQLWRAWSWKAVVVAVVVLEVRVCCHRRPMRVWTLWTQRSC